jgi:thiamine-monophosphate kinase
MSDSSGSGNNEDMDEFGLIARLAELIDAPSLSKPESVLTGIGDDTAVVAAPSAHLLLTTDAIVDGVHFRSADERWYDIGWKCAVSNLSDIAAMGGIPDHALVTLGVPPGASVDTYLDFYSGMNEAFERFGGRVVGGDVVSAPTMFVNLALTGHPSIGPDGKAAWLERSQAKLGDLVCVSGPLGSSAGGLEFLLSGDKNPSGRELVDRHYRPAPRLEIGSALVAAGVRCAMDISDGLVGDLEKIAKSSAVGITIEMTEVPLATELVFMFGTSAIELALGGGEDYELAFTAAEEIVNRLPNAVRNEISVIGRVTSEDMVDAEVTVVDDKGELYEPLRSGWDHLDG